MPVQTDVEKIQESISRSAQSGIASSSNDSGAVSAMSITDQIKAANYLAGKNASVSNGFGIRFAKIIPPGAG